MKGTLGLYRIRLQRYPSYFLIFYNNINNKSPTPHPQENKNK